MVVGAVLVHYRFWPGIARTLEALLGQTRPPEQLLMLDDRSADGSAEQLADAYPTVEVRVAPENRGCVRNFNAGMREMLDRGVDAILLLTHETELEPDALEQLVDRLEQAPATGAVGPLLGFLSRPDTVFSAGGMLLEGTWQNPHAGMYARVDDWRGATPRPVPWLDTACVLLRARALMDTGLLNERYHHYYDDVELGVRLNQAGWSVECVCGAVARQEPGGLSEYYRVRNRLGFIAATAPRRVLLRAAGCHLRQMLRDALIPGGRGDLALAQARALRDAVRGRWGPAPAEVAAPGRRDWATGGALDGPADPSWAPEPGRDAAFQPPAPPRAAPMAGATHAWTA
jgi:N-acetylglucosaminyl-diphospho-decaprenol L-rhamnosyltransferase